MERFRIIASLMLILVMVAVDARTSFGHDLIVRVKDKKEVAFKEMVKDLKGAKVVYVGETHDNQDHHDLQLRIMQELHRARIPLAIGMEMFTSGSQKELDRWTAGTLSKRRFQEVYLNDWSAPWPLYGDILLFARKNRIPIIGLNVPREITRKVARQGFDALSKEERLRLPPSITCDVDDSYMAMIRRSYSDHDTNAKTFKNFCEAQMLWNKSMAYTMLEFMKKNPNRTVVVITGSGHAVRGGMPAQVSSQNPELTSRVVLPDPAIPTPQLTVEDADYLWLSH
ncbi:MAG: hypothetical protein ED859_13305 [Desulfuromonadales bacterium]|nr:MAG: hypothetical protein ED859_13305 [Desulfuromonadales bacterium]